MTEAELWQLLFMAIEASSGNFTIFGPYQRAVDFAAQLEAFQPGWTFMANRGLLYAGTTLIPLSVVVSLCFSTTCGGIRVCAPQRAEPGAFPGSDCLPQDIAA